MSTGLLIGFAVVSAIQIVLQLASSAQADALRKALRLDREILCAHLQDISTGLIDLKNQRMRNLNQINQNLAALCETANEIRNAGMSYDDDDDDIIPATGSFDEIDTLLSKLDERMIYDWEDDRETQQAILKLMEHVRSSIDGNRVRLDTGNPPDSF